MHCLLAARADVNRSDAEGVTPLLAAVVRDNLEELDWWKLPFLPDLKLPWAWGG